MALAPAPSVRPRDARAGSEGADSGMPWDARRVLNCLAALAGIAITAPVMLVVGVLIKATSPGPVFYTQDRIGVDRRSGHRRRRGVRVGFDPEDGAAPDGAVRTMDRRASDVGGRRFRIYKFRTMCVGSDRYGQVWAAQDDPRVTPLGRVLRKTRLDELPQLFNVLKGDMNVVGPRPEQPHIFDGLRREIPGYERRQQVLPGITGWAQINHCYDRCLDDVRKKLALDLEYIERSSVGKDLVIMARTPSIMLHRNGGW